MQSNNFPHSSKYREMEYTGTLKMEISEQTLVDLVKGQARIEQTVLDVKERFDKAIPYLMEQDETNAKSIRTVENRQWYFGGAGTAVGFIASKLGAHYITLFGGK